MLKKYTFTGEVKRTVNDTITVAIYADDENEAALKARELLRIFPKPSAVEGVSYCYVENREQEDIDVRSLKGKDGKELL